MNELDPQADEGSRGAGSPGDLLDALREHPDWDERRRDEVFDELLRRFPAAELIAAARGRLGVLAGGDGEAVLRIVEAFGDDSDRERLARSLVAQPDLPPERAWEALSILEGSGRIEAEPELAERWEELVDLIEGDDPLDALAAQLEEGPDGVWVALEGLGAVEPEVRAAIVAGLARAPTRPGLVEFLRHLAFSSDPATRSAALEALEAREAGPSYLDEAWETIAGRHADPESAARARGWLGRRPVGEGRLGPPAWRESPRVLRGFATPADGLGRAEVALVSEDRGTLVAAAFACDLEAGIRGVVGQSGFDADAVEDVIADLLSGDGGGPIEVAPALALGLLAGAWLLSGPAAPPVLPYWIERVAGPEFRPGPLAATLDGFDAETPAASEAGGCARQVLDACPSWIDRSDLTYDLAEESRLRGEASSRDGGAVRYLFERRLLGRLEAYRRMLLWMATLWGAEGSAELARGALGLAGQLGDPQHAVPGYPFLAELAGRSLEAARSDLDGGRDPRGGRSSPGPVR